jgi:hypothetical protein
MAGAKIALSSTSGELKTDGNDNARVNLPTTGIQAGFSRLNYLRDAATSREAQISEEGGLEIRQGRLLFHTNFNGAAAGALINNQYNQQTTTMTLALNAGFLRFNNSAITTINTGAAIFTHRIFSVEAKCTLALSAHIRHTQGAVSNKQMDFGFGYYDIAANQAAAMNEFMGFRWTQAGNLIGVLEYSAGGAPTTVTVNINGGVPYADSATKRYEIQVSQEQVEFWVDGAYVASIARQADAPGVCKANGYPVIARLYNTGSAPAIAPVFDLANVNVVRYGFEADIPLPTRQALMGRHSNQHQAGQVATNGNTALIQASATAPTGTTANGTTTAAITGLGGYYRLNGASVVAAEHTNLIICSYQNPLLPEAAGVALDARNLIITDILISPMVVSTVLVGGGAVWGWFIAVGHNAISLATADAAGTTALGTVSPRVLPLPLYDQIAAAAAVGTVATRTGQSAIHLQTPLVVQTGGFVAVGIRTKHVAALISSGVLDGQIGISGYWD